MDAKEARARSLRITGDKERKQYDKVKLKITEAVDSGKLETHFYEYLLPSVERTLNNEGYKTTSSSHRNEVMVNIAW